MNGINKVILVGTLGQDPAHATSKNGKGYTKLRLATNRYWKNEDGKSEQQTEWHSVQVWGKRGETCEDFLKKGSPVCVEGRISSFQSEENGEKRWHTCIVADDVNFLPTRKELIQ